MRPVTSYDPRSRKTRRESDFYARSVNRSLPVLLEQAACADWGDARRGIRGAVFFHAICQRAARFGAQHQVHRRHCATPPAECHPPLQHGGGNADSHGGELENLRPAMRTRPRSYNRPPAMTMPSTATRCTLGLLHTWPAPLLACTAQRPSAQADQRPQSETTSLRPPIL